MLTKLFNKLIYLIIFFTIACTKEEHIRINYYPNGVIRSKGPVENGLHQGTWQYYYSDGLFRWEGEVINGKRQYNKLLPELVFPDTITMNMNQDWDTVGLRIRNLIADDFAFYLGFQNGISIRYLDEEQTLRNKQYDLFIIPEQRSTQFIMFNVEEFEGKKLDPPLMVLKYFYVR